MTTRYDTHVQTDSVQTTFTFASVLYFDFDLKSKVKVVLRSEMTQKMNFKYSSGEKYSSGTTLKFLYNRLVCFVSEESILKESKVSNRPKIENILKATRIFPEDYLFSRNDLT